MPKEIFNCHVFTSLFNYRKKARELAEHLGIQVEEGIYIMNGGPQYETAAECAFITRIGGDAVGE
jgi:purine-nucleoside phosphorylase